MGDRQRPAVLQPGCHKTDEDFQIDNLIRSRDEKLEEITDIMVRLNQGSRQAALWRESGNESHLSLMVDHTHLVQNLALLQRGVDSDNENIQRLMNLRDKKKVDRLLSRDSSGHLQLISVGIGLLICCLAAWRYSKLHTVDTLKVSSLGKP